jgi:hypothetical protein
MNNRTVGDRSSETWFHSIDMNNNNMGYEWFLGYLTALFQQLRSVFMIGKKVRIWKKAIVGLVCLNVHDRRNGGITNNLSQNSQ